MGNVIYEERVRDCETDSVCAMQRNARLRTSRARLGDLGFGDLGFVDLGFVDADFDDRCTACA
jgi:hypothetical protein